MKELLSPPNEGNTTCLKAASHMQKINLFLDIAYVDTRFIHRIRTSKTMHIRTLSFLSTNVSRRYMSIHSFTISGDGISGQEILHKLCEKFKSAGVSEPSMSAQLLVGEVIGITNLDVLPQVIEHSRLTSQQSERLERMTQCRLARMPVQYILGYWDFRHIRLKTMPPVFIPRSETEELVGHVLDHIKLLHDVDNIQLLEIGCGSGAISLSLMREHDTKYNFLNILAIDQSRSACSLTLENAIKLQLLPPNLQELPNGNSFTGKYMLVNRK